MGGDRVHIKAVYVPAGEKGKLVVGFSSLVRTAENQTPVEAKSISK